jgi:hypothetical protein
MKMLYPSLKPDEVAPMILTANAEIARQTTRRRTANGWHTTFIGQNRNTLKQGETPPEAGTLYPMPSWSRRIRMRW